MTAVTTSDTNTTLASMLESVEASINRPQSAVHTTSIPIRYLHASGEHSGVPFIRFSLAHLPGGDSSEEAV
jgi:hypothetical protein